MLSMKKRYTHYAMYTGGTVFFIVLVYFALLADAFYSGGDQKLPPQMAQIVPSLPIEKGHLNDNEKVVILNPENGKKSISRKIDVDGKAPRGASVLLFVNGVLAGKVQSAEDGSYRFTNIELLRHANVIQTRFHGTDGSSASSRAIMVFHRNTEPAK
jgi:hypothetical protein